MRIRARRCVRWDDGGGFALFDDGGAGDGCVGCERVAIINGCHNETAFVAEVGATLSLSLVVCHSPRAKHVICRSTRGGHLHLPTQKFQAIVRRQMSVPLTVVCHKCFADGAEIVWCQRVRWNRNRELVQLTDEASIGGALDEE